VGVGGGDVLQVQINETVEVRLENNPIFLGEVGDLGGQTAVSLTKRITQ
jgi:flagellar motor switch protein FliM